jgi:hypothetical protein
MGKVRKVALWGLGVVLTVLVLLWATGSIGPVYRWMVRYMPAEVWSALAAWVAVVVAIVTVVVVGLYAREQVREARRTREEQAQPNVVLYVEPNADVPQILEIVVRNFGTTPAYNVTVDVAPPVKSTPNLETLDKIADVPIPRFPILAPGQEWRTVWDSAVARKDYLDKLNRRLGAGELSQSDFDEQDLTPRHEATVSYTDSRHRRFETPSLLDFDQRNGTMWVDVKTIHDLTKLLDKTLSTQNDALIAIHRRLAQFGSEHEGVWVYGSGDDGERDYRRQMAEAEESERRQSKAAIDRALGITPAQPPDETV